MVFRVLGLHGSQQNIEVLRTRLGRIVPKVKKLVTFSYLNAPHELLIRDGDEVSYRTWYLRDNNGVTQVSLEKSFHDLLAYWQEKGPFDGIFGFSQGGMIATLIATRPDLFPGLKFMILAGSPDIGELSVPNIGKEGSGIPGIPITLRSLHFAGLADSIVDLSSSRNLAARFHGAQFIEHEQGHCIPTKANYIALMIKFIESMSPTEVEEVDIIKEHATDREKVRRKEIKLKEQPKVLKGEDNKREDIKREEIKRESIKENDHDTSKQNIGIRKDPVKIVFPIHNCTSESNAEQQRDEIEALESIYPDSKIILTRPPPLNTSMPSACFSLLLTIPCSEDIVDIYTSTKTKSIGELPILRPHLWIGELRLVIDLPSGYPEEVSEQEVSEPRLNIEVGNLSMMEFPSALRKSLLVAVIDAANKSNGSPYAFSCIQAANDWLAVGGWLTAGSLHIDSKSPIIVPSANTGRLGPPNTDPVLEKKGFSKLLSLIEDINQKGGWRETSEKELEEEERRESVFVKIATNEACKISGGIMRDKEKRIKECSIAAGEKKGENKEEKRNLRTNFGKKMGSSMMDYEGNGIVDESDSGSSDDTVDSFDCGEYDASNLESCAIDMRTSTTKGVWKYTVGLVGKPSAGKSTFFNAATHAALRGLEGQKMAEVAAHPFTTIEPNVGPGWFAGPSDTGTSDWERDRSSCHGRDESGRRLLPVMIKDVAGLVPGAYKGRGKGNKFLNDLCDADVLVHVVDVTGQSDQDGNALPKGEVGSSPSEDAQWIREELHRWIHGNIKSKWSSVCRKGVDPQERLCSLFSGYQGSRSDVERGRGKLELDRALQWTAGDVHRFVAHYLAIRFPVCLALNKIDAFEEEIQGLDLDKKDEVEEKITRKVLLLADLNSDKATLATTLPCDSEDKIKTIKKNGKEIVQFCQKQAIQRGETAVAVSAFVEGWEILKRSARVLENERRNFDSLYSERRTKLLDLDQIKVEKDNKEDHAFLPSVGSLLWLINESAAKRVNDIWKSTGVLEAVSAAVALKQPVYCYPVSDLDTEAPIGWTSSMGLANSTNNGNSDMSKGLNKKTDIIPRLKDCLLLRPGSTVGDVFDALKRGALPHIIIQGEFVRAEGKGLAYCFNSDGINCGSSSLNGKRQVGRDVVIDHTCCVIRIQTNRKAVWQHQQHQQKIT